MDPQNPYSGKLVPSSCPPCLPALDYSPNSTNSATTKTTKNPLLSRRNVATNNVAKNKGFQPPAYLDGMQQLAYLDVHNHSLHTQGFVVYPSTPTITSPSADKVDMQIRVFQASKLLQGDGHGTIRFMLPCAPPLNWGKPEEQPAIIVMAGSRSANQDQNFGPTGGVRPIPSGSYWKLVTTGPNNGNMAKNVCVLTAPAGSEPFILTDEAMKTGGYAFAQDLDKGMFRILTDELLGTNKSVIAFAGIGAVNPNFPNHVVPIVTWDVAPSSVYTVKADMSSWQVVALSNSAPATALDFSTLPSSIPVAFAPAPESNATDVYFTANNSFSNEP